MVRERCMFKGYCHHKKIKVVLMLEMVENFVTVYRMLKNLLGHAIKKNPVMKEFKTA